jgi:hypothetical protein
MNIAITHGIAVNPEAAAHAAKATLARWKAQFDDFTLTTCSYPAEEGVPPNYTTDAATRA